MTGIHVDQLSYHYGAKTALDNVSIDVERGQFCALLGPNGAGKSTLYNLLTRLFVPPSGTIAIDGHRLDRNPRAALGRLGIVFQQSTLDLDLTVLQNLRYFAALQGLSGALRDRRIAQVLDRLDIADRVHQKARALNGGHRRRTEIARALLHDPAVLLLDEPTVGLDAAARNAITQYVHDLAADGKSVLWATHLADEVRPDDQLVILHQAKVLAAGQARDISAGQSLQDRFMALTGARA